MRGEAWWKFDKGLQGMEQSVDRKARCCQLCGRLIDQDYHARPLPFCDQHSTERDQIVAQVQAHERQAFEALVAILGLAEKYPAYAPYTVTNALAHLSGTLIHVESVIAQQTALRAEARESRRASSAQN